MLWLWWGGRIGALCEADWDELEILCGARARKSPGGRRTRRQREIVRRSASLVRAISRGSGGKGREKKRGEGGSWIIKEEAPWKGKGKEREAGLLARTDPISTTG